MNVARKHAEIIKAWADGYEVEAYNPERDLWITVAEPGWFNDIEYRVKPGEMETPRESVCSHYDVAISVSWPDDDCLDLENYPADEDYNLRLTFKNNKLVEAKVIDNEREEDDLPW